MNTAWAAEWLHRFSATDLTTLMEMYADDVSFENFAGLHRDPARRFRCRSHRGARPAEREGPYDGGTRH